MKKVITRFPPSPTGHLHLGGVRTALFNWLYAQKCGGEFILRIEDTDLVRSTPEAVDTILDAMQWLGLRWSQGPYFQTHRFDRYRNVAQQLFEEGKAYYCECQPTRLAKLREKQIQQGVKPKYDHLCRDKNLGPGAGFSLRFKNPLEGSVSFDDVLKGKVNFQNKELDDLVIVRSDGAPTYNLTVVVDDMDMLISHVIRGDDHINNTPRQINILRAIGAELPTYVHIPLILNQDGRRLSKRDGAASVLDLKQEGILPKALINYLVRLGWAHGNQEIFDIDEMISLFDLKDIHSAPATFDREKLMWFNQQYLHKHPISDVALDVSNLLNKKGIALSQGPMLKNVIPFFLHRASTLADLASQVEFLYRDNFTTNEEAEAVLTADAVPCLKLLIEELNQCQDWTQEELSIVLKKIVKQEGVQFKFLAQPLRAILSGTLATPSIDIVLMLLGRDKTLMRLEKKISRLSKNRR